MGAFSRKSRLNIFLERKRLSFPFACSSSRQFETDFTVYYTCSIGLLGRVSANFLHDVALCDMLNMSILLQV